MSDINTPLIYELQPKYPSFLERKEAKNFYMGTGWYNSLFAKLNRRQGSALLDSDRLPRAKFLPEGRTVDNEHRNSSWLDSMFIINGACFARREFARTQLLNGSHVKVLRGS